MLGLLSRQAGVDGVDPRQNAVSFVRLSLTRQRFCPSLRLRCAQKHGVRFHLMVNLSRYVVQTQVGLRREHGRNLFRLPLRVGDPRDVSVQTGRPQRSFNFLRHKRALSRLLLLFIFHNELRLMKLLLRERVEAIGRRNQRFGVFS